MLCCTEAIQNGLLYMWNGDWMLPPVCVHLLRVNTHNRLFQFSKCDLYSMLLLLLSLFANMPDYIAMCITRSSSHHSKIIIRIIIIFYYEHGGILEIYSGNFREIVSQSMKWRLLFIRYNSRKGIKHVYTVDRRVNVGIWGKECTSVIVVIACPHTGSSSIFDKQKFIFGHVFDCRWFALLRLYPLMFNDFFYAAIWSHS